MYVIAFHPTLVDRSHIIAVQIRYHRHLNWNKPLCHFETSVPKKAESTCLGASAGQALDGRKAKKHGENNKSLAGWYDWNGNC